MIFKKFKTYILDLWRNKDYFKLIAVSASSILIMILAVQLLTILISFISKKFEVILLFGTICFVSYWYFQNKGYRYLNNTVKQDKSDSIVEKELLENNYIELRKILFQSLDDCADVLNLIKPVNLSSLDSPSKMIIKGRLYSYQYVVLKKNEVNCQAIKNVLQQRINQKLENFEFEGLRQTKFIYKGFCYPIVQVHSVKEVGEYIHIELVFVNDNYIDLLNLRKNMLLDELYYKNEVYDSDF